MNPQIGRIQKILFNSLIWLNLPLSLLAALVFYALLGREIAWFPDGLDELLIFFGNDFETPSRPFGLLTIILILYLGAYLLSFDFDAKRRPHIRILFIHTQIAMILLFSVISGFDMPVMFLTVLIGAAIVCGYPALLWGLERLLSRLASALATALLVRERYAVGLPVLYLAILLRPDDSHQRKMLGAARFESGDVLGTIAVLEPLVGEHCTDRAMLEALEECYRTERMWDKVLAIALKRLDLQPERPLLRLRAARVLKQLDRLREAATLLSEAMPVRNLDYMNELFDTQIQLQQYDDAARTVKQMETLESAPGVQALKAWHRLLKTAPKHIPTLEGLADLLMQSDNPTEGANFLEEIVRLNSDRYDVRRRLVQFYQESNLLLRAEPHLVALMDAGMQTADVALLYGDILVQKEEYDRALMHFQFAVEQYPDDYRFPFFLAQIAFRTGALEEAVRQLDEASQRTQKPADQNRIKSLRRRVEDSTADRDLQMIQERCRRNPNDISLRFAFIEAATNSNMPERAIAEYETLLGDMPSEKERILAHLEKNALAPNSHFRLMDYLADLRLKEQRWDDALRLARMMAERSLHSDQLLAEHARRIIERKPDHVPALKCYAEIMEKLERWEEALQALLGLAQHTDPKDPPLRRRIFIAHARLDHVREAIEVGEKLLAEHNHDVDIRIMLVELYIPLERYEEAYHHLQRAQDADPTYNIRIIRLMNQVSGLLRQQQLDSLLRILENEPENMKAHMQVGDIYIAMGEPKKSIAHLQKAAQDPGLRNLCSAKLANAMARLRMFDLAEETLETVKLNVEDSEEQKQLKVLFFDTAEIFEGEAETERAIKFFKQVFRVDASFRNIVDKIETLGG